MTDATEDPETLAEVYELAERHADAGQGDRDDYLPTYEGSLVVGGMEVSFHIDNDPSIYYTVAGVDDLVFAGDQPGADWVTAEEFTERVRQVAAEQRERYDQ